MCDTYMCCFFVLIVEGLTNEYAGTSKNCHCLLLYTPQIHILQLHDVL